MCSTNAQHLHEISLISAFSKIGTFWPFWPLLGLKLLSDGEKYFSDVHFHKELSTEVNYLCAPFTKP